MDMAFSHNDIHGGNCLKLLDGRLMIIDYETAAYNYRSYDIANYFSQCMLNSSHNEFPYFLYDYDAFPSAHQQWVFVSAYVAAVAEKSQGRMILDPQRVCNEANNLVLASIVFWSYWGVVQAAESTIEFSYLVRSLLFD